MYIAKHLTILLLWLSAMIGNPAWAHAQYEDELPEGYITVVSQDGTKLLETGRMVYAGDQYLAENNRLYQITEVHGRWANARYLETVALDFDLEYLPVSMLAQQTEKILQIYHTHTDESYIPTDGKASTPGRGSVLQVGEVFANRLKELGYTVTHDQTLHEPHDVDAYNRSRRTMFKLLREQPAALFDIHRNSAPAEAYSMTVDGKLTSKIMLVVGQANQNRPTTFEYAKQLKAASDTLHPKLVRGIFLAKGGYNQDLSPRAMLIEVGTQSISREAAERGIILFADAIPLVIGRVVKAETAPTPSEASLAPQQPPPTSTGTTSKNIWGILGLTVLAIVAFLFLSTGSWNEAKSKLKRLKNIEFTNFLGTLRKKRR